METPSRNIRGSRRIPGKAVPLCAAFLFVLSACTPSREFLLKQSLAAGVDRQYVRVLVANTTERVLVSGQARMRISDLKTRKVHYDGQGSQVYFYPEKVLTPVVVESWGSTVCVNGTCYRGLMELHNILGRIYVINVVTMDEYLCGVVPKEVSPSWDDEAIKAQAVAARTYAYYHLMQKKDAIYDLDATTNFQVYGGFSAENERTSRAVSMTSGEIAAFNNKPIQAFFHSTCGGATTDDRFVWEGDDKEYIAGVKCEYCKNSPHYSWDETITLYEMRMYLEKKYKGVGAITGLSFKKNEGRITSVTVTHKNGRLTVTGNEFRLLFPDKKIKSTWFEAVKTREGLALHGHGWGHGVGLCQWGAEGMAQKGSGYRDILKYYYRGIQIINIGGRAAQAARPHETRTGRNISLTDPES